MSVGDAGVFVGGMEVLVGGTGVFVAGVCPSSDGLRQKFSVIGAGISLTTMIRPSVSLFWTTTTRHWYFPAPSDGAGTRCVDSRVCPTEASGLSRRHTWRSKDSFGFNLPAHAHSNVAGPMMESPALGEISSGAGYGVAGGPMPADDPVPGVE